MSGYFSRSSMAHRALSHRAVSLTYGQRALTVGALHPLLFQGTAQSTTHRGTPYRRLALTARLFEAVFLGDREEADRALAFTARRHEPVHGRIEQDGGPQHPAGSPYSAADPELMWWTAAFTLDSVEHQYDNLVRRLSPADRQALFEDFVTWAELFGMPRSAAPADYTAFRAGFDAFLVSDSAHLSEEALQVGRYIAGYDVPHPAPLPTRPVFSTINLIVTGSLPGHVRERFGMNWTFTDEAAFQAVARASRLAHQGVPLLARSPLLRGRSQEFYKLVARGERALLASGRASMPGVSDRQIDPLAG